MSNRPALHRPTSTSPNDIRWNRSALLITCAITSLTTVVALLFLSATQLTARGTAQQFLTQAVTSLLEVDRWVANAWPELQAAAAAGEALVLAEYPISLQLDPSSLSAGPEAIAADVARATASVIYDDGLAVLSDSPQAFRVISQGAAFDGTIGRLTAGGHTVATIGLIVSGTLLILLVLAIIAQSRGISRFGLPATALALGGFIVWVVALILGASFDGRADATLDPFAADLWLIATDALSLVLRNAAIVALASGIVAAISLAGSWLLRVVENTDGVRVSGVR